jgi:general secretion pathway protein K
VVYRGMLDQRRAGTLFALDQGFEIALGAEAWAAEVLQRDQQQSTSDNLAETWAKPLPPLPIEGGTVTGRLVDLQGRFNLNNLVFADGTTNPAAVQQFARILASLDIEPGWASAMADWIDEDTQPAFPDGAEDSVYTGQDPPRLAANMPITRASEILSLPDFGAERYAKLRPYVTALPVGTRLNVCTAPGIVLDALSENVREFGRPCHAPRQRLLSDACRPARSLRRRGLQQGQGLNLGNQQLLRRDGMGHYWHHGFHAVQSARAWPGRTCAPPVAQFRNRMILPRPDA